MHKSMDNQADWDLYRYFYAVLQAGSLSAAARQLLTTQSTVSRQISKLESSLGVSLFSRSPEGLQPTPAALQLLEPVSGMSTAVAIMQRRISQATGAGVLRLTVPEVLGVEVITPLLAVFQQQHLGLQLELSIAEHNEDLLRREADLAIRMIAPQQGALLARGLGQSCLSLYAHRDYLAQHGTPLNREDLAQHRLIGYDRNLGLHAHWQAQGFALPIEALAFRSDCAMARLAALRSGMGIGLCHAALAQREPALMALPAQLFSFELGVWVVMHNDQRDQQNLRQLFDYLADALPAALQLRH
jgi:DNA-binding transcriptional LysR family regulator